MTEERVGPGSSVAKSVIQMNFVIYTCSLYWYIKSRGKMKMNFKDLIAFTLELRN